MAFTSSPVRALEETPIWSALSVVDPHPVFGLLTRSRPATVFWSVISIVVDAIDGVFGGRAWSHVGQKIQQRFFPTLANANATSTITPIVLARFFVASNFHVTPRDVVACPIETVTELRLSRAFFLETSTTQGKFVSQRIGHNVFESPAIAQTTPTPWSTRYQRLNHEATNSAPRQIDRGNRHRVNAITCSEVI